MDHYMLVDRFPQQGQDTRIQKSFFRVGGCAVNVAATLKNLGCEAYIVANIGDDHWGKEIERYLREKGFNLDCIKICSQQSTGYSVSIIEPSGERTFLTYKGCEERFSLDMISPFVLDKIGFVYLTGYYLLNPDYYQEILAVLKRIKGHGGRILFDPGPLVSEIESEMLVSVLNLSDIVTPNHVEYQQLAELVRPEESLADWLFDHGVEWVIEKMGGNGVHAKSKHQCIVMPAYPVNSIDTTGAGDSFAGGLLYSLVQDYSLEQALRIGSACGALTAQIMGPHGSFTINDVHQMICKN